MLNKLYQASMKVFVPQRLDETYKVIVDEAVKLVEAKYASVFVLENGSFNRISASSPTLMKVVPRKRGHTFHVWSTKKAYLLPSDIIAKNHPQFSEFGVGSDISVPLHMHDVQLGVLSVLSPKEKPFSENELQALRLYASLISAALYKNQLNEKLAASIQARDLFSSIAAHEIRTPLTNISIYADLLAQQLTQKRPLSPMHVSAIQKEVRRTNNVIQEFLSTASRDSFEFQYHLKKHLISEIVEQNVYNFQHRFPKLNLVYKNRLRSKDIAIIADDDKLQQAFTNILNNAAKFSPVGSSIYLTLSNTKTRVYIRIRDTGVGIPSHKLPHIFKKFYTSSRTNEHGMGLGLYLVDQIITKHRGTVRVRSKIDVGTTFTISIPIYTGE